jgi:hypothetical protein
MVLTWLGAATAGSADAFQTGSDEVKEEPADLIVGSASIVAGFEVSPPGKYPFIVALTSSQSGTQFCGGSLIDARWILTAAHCVTDGFGIQNVLPPDVNVIVGRHDLTTLAGQELNVSRIIIHPLFSATTFHNDIALLELATLAASGEPIQLAQPGDRGLWEEGAAGTVMGWGTTDLGFSSDTLMEVAVPFRDDAACALAWVSGLEPSTQVCAAGTSGQDSCQGDSGGPLVGPAGNGPWTLIGIVSYGLDCGNGTVPAVYTEVASFVEWIRDSADLHTGGIPASGIPICIESTFVQTDPAAGDLGVGDRFTGSDNITYLIATGAPSCTLNCVDGFDINCDGILGDFCPVELDLNRVAAVAECLATLAPAEPETVVTGTGTSPNTPASVPRPIPIARPSALALTGAGPSLTPLGLVLIAIGATATAVGTRRRDNTSD